MAFQWKVRHWKEMGNLDFYAPDCPYQIEIESTMSRVQRAVFDRI